MYYNDRDQLLKDNYIEQILQNYNEDDVKDVVNKIRSMDNNLFVLKFQAKGDKFEMAYPPERGTKDYDNYVTSLKSYWLGNTNSILDVAPAMVTAMLNI